MKGNFVGSFFHVRLGARHFVPLAFLFFSSVGCGVTSSLSVEGPLSYMSNAATLLAGNNPLKGSTQPIHDPSVIRQGSTYYVFTTDVLGLPPGNNLPIRCSQNQVKWISCGSIFPQMPTWLTQRVPGIVGLWAPDVSYFNGVYHVYYAASTLNSQRSVIGLVTNTTLDPADPAYKWVDQGEVIASKPGDDFNAIDPNIFIDADNSIWMTYGSYWSGIKQVQLDANTGKPAANFVRYNLATRPEVPNDPIEGASIIHHGKYYYLFVSIDYCCNYELASDDYKEAVGRSTSPHGPFTDIKGTPMMSGGATVLLESNGTWNAPGGGTAFVDPASGESLIVFHALNMAENGATCLWLKQISWVNDWPALD